MKFILLCKYSCIPLKCLNFVCPVPEEAVPPGEGCGGGEAGHQAPLPEEGHQQGRLQGDPQEVCQPGMSPYISKFAKH